MKLWKRASGVLKDQNSIWLATLRRRTAFRNPDIDAAVIKSTSHDESRVDYRNAQRVFAWVRVSPAYVKPLVWAISVRMEKTRSWVVALKGLMLMHGVFCCKVPAIQRIGRLPFDLSNFKDEHARPEGIWGHNEFIRAYYTFLDQKSSFIFLHAQEQRKGQHHNLRRIGGSNLNDDKILSTSSSSSSMMQDLVWLQTMQGLLDMLLQIKPKSEAMVGVLILEAMDCVVIEIFDVYSRICSAIAKVLTRIYSAGKVEASMALKILQKATSQSEELSDYFAFCKYIGVLGDEDCPVVKQIPEEDIRELEQVINGVSEKFNEKIEVPSGCDKDNKSLLTLVKSDSLTTSVKQEEKTNPNLKTIITNNWEVFDDDQPKNVAQGKEQDHFLPLVPLIDIEEHGNKNRQLPDLISFC